MARLWQCGFELGTLSANVEITATLGTTALSTTTVRTGSRALRIATTNTTSSVRYHVFSSNQAVAGFQRVYLFVASLPSATTYICRFLDTANSSTGSIRLTTAGRLQLMTANGNQIGSDSDILATNTWYMVELGTDATGSGTLEGRLDGVSFASGANSSQGDWARITLGVITTNATADLFFDDWAINDASGSAQNSWPGPGGILHLIPNGDGDSHGWSNTSNAAGSANNYQLVDESPPNDTTDLVQTGTPDATDMYALADSGIGASDTVSVVAVGLRLRNNTADPTAAVRTQIEKTSAGTIAQGSAIVSNSTAFATNSPVEPRNYSLVTYADPDGAAWTQATLDSAQAGVKLTVANAQRIQVTALWVSVDYTPNVGGGETIVDLDPALESDTALALGRLKTKTTPPAAELETAAALGTAKTRALTAASETGTAQPLGRAKTANLTLASSSETAQELGRTKTSQLGTAIETDEAIEVTVGGDTTLALSPAIEVETAASLGRHKTLALTPAVETGTPQTLGAAKARAVTAAQETGTALALGRTKTTTLVTAAEVGTAQPLGRTKTVALSPAAETGTAQPFGRAKTLAVAAAGETDAAITLARAKTTAVAAAAENDTAHALGVAKNLGLPAAGATEAAQALSHAKTKQISAAAETDQAVSLGPAGPVIAVEAAVESDTAQAVTRAKTRMLAPSIELDAAVLLARIKTRPLTLAAETGTAVVLPRGKARALAAAAELDSAGTFGRAKRRPLGTAIEVDTAVPILSTGGATPVAPGVLTPATVAPSLTATSAGPELVASAVGAAVLVATTSP
ncbi:hypothetical protein [Acrocarpospora sp. B8E8]|uniref:hypothetical protein n=1 Tax=Acrocarpospora sp. B8E8 TaxID=3153572 RepID=UPI00325CE774